MPRRFVRHAFEMNGKAELTAAENSMTSTLTHRYTKM